MWITELEPINTLLGIQSYLSGNTLVMTVSLLSTTMQSTEETYLKYYCRSYDFCNKGHIQMNEEFDHP